MVSISEDLEQYFSLQSFLQDLVPQNDVSLMNNKRMISGQADNIQIVSINSIVDFTGKEFRLLIFTSSSSSVQNWFITSLAFADLSLGLIIMPFPLDYEVENGLATDKDVSTFNLLQR